MKRIEIAHGKLLLILITTIGTTLVPPCVDAKPTADDLKNAITQASILGPDCRINVVTESNQAIVTTFLDRASKREDDDCKINAVLIAKNIMQMDSDVVKVKVLFYDVDAVKYRQVVVKAGDVLALGGGQIDNQKLLSSLEITSGSRSEESTPSPSPVTSGPAVSVPTSTTATTPSKDLPPNTAVATSTATATTPKTSSGTNASASTTPPAKTSSPSPPTFSAAGITFTYPRDWIPKRGANASVLAHFFSSTMADTNYIDVDFFNENRSVEGLADEKYKDWLYQPNYQVVYSGAIKLGAKGTIAGVSRLITYQIENYPEYRYYQRHVFFGKPGRIYCLRYHAQYKDMQKVNAAFEHMLVTLQVQGSNPSTAPRSTAGGKKR